MNRSLQIAALSLLVASPLLAQHEGHVQQVRPAAIVPTEAGQDAFAAITEIVALLEADSTTNWSKVDLEALRRHLVDMNNVVLQSTPRAKDTPGGAVFIISAPPAVRPALERMVTMHAVELNRMPEWRAVVTTERTQTVLTVVAASATDSATVQRIRGLGFIGLLATGSHHQAHHLAIAKGMQSGHTERHD